MKENKLIAEFMGFYRTEKGYIMGGFGDGTFGLAEELHFHTSWDWLMPVVSKCFKTGDDTHQWDNIMDTMFTCDINIVYAQVVEFINQYKKNKQN